MVQTPIERPLGMQIKPHTSVCVRSLVKSPVAKAHVTRESSEPPQFLRLDMSPPLLRPGLCVMLPEFLWTKAPAGPCRQDVLQRDPPTCTLHVLRRHMYPVTRSPGPRTSRKFHNLPLPLACPLMGTLHCRVWGCFSKCVHPTQASELVQVPKGWEGLLAGSSRSACDSHRYPPRRRMKAEKTSNPEGAQEEAKYM